MAEGHPFGATQEGEARGGCYGDEARDVRGAWSLAGEAVQALGVMLGFVAFGLLCAGLGERAGATGPVYPVPAVANASLSRGQAGTHAEDLAPGPTTWLVDGFNVVNVAMLRADERSAWWRAPARQRLVALAECFDDDEAGLWIVFDGPRPAASTPDDLRDRRVGVRFEPSADRWLLAQVKAAPDPTRLRVVTADHRLASRARHRGARVVPPQAFLARCTRCP